MKESMESLSREASVPVQSRVNLIVLANLDHYWMREGYSVSSMSQLIAQSLKFLWDVIEVNNMAEQRFETLEEANQYLRSRGLYQRSMKKLGNKKLATAMSLESVRNEGGDPRFYAPRQHKMLHRSNAVKVQSIPVEKGPGKHLDIIEEAIQKNKAEDRKKNAVPIEEAITKFQSNQKVEEEKPALKEGATDDELDEYDRKREVKENEKLKALNELDELPVVGKDK